MSHSIDNRFECFVCWRFKSVVLTWHTLANGVTVKLCADCKADRFKLAEAERRVAAEARP